MRRPEPAPVVPSLPVAGTNSVSAPDATTITRAVPLSLAVSRRVPVGSKPTALIVPRSSWRNASCFFAAMS